MKRVGLRETHISSVCALRRIVQTSFCVSLRPVMPSRAVAEFPARARRKVKEMDYACQCCREVAVLSTRVFAIPDRHARMNPFLSSRVVVTIRMMNRRSSVRGHSQMTFR